MSESSKEKTRNPLLPVISIQNHKLSPETQKVLQKLLNPKEKRKDNA